MHFPSTDFCSFCVSTIFRAYALQDLEGVKRWGCPHHSCGVCHRKTAAAGGLLFRCEVRSSLLDYGRQDLKLQLSHGKGILLTSHAGLGRLRT